VEGCDSLVFEGGGDVGHVDTDRGPISPPAKKDGNDVNRCINPICFGSVVVTSLTM
jgi:hypothetical protein